MSALESTSARAHRMETLWAAVLALLLGLLVVGRPVWDSDFVYLATDTATVQAPWNGAAPPANRELSDSGVAFYPHYRRVSESWRSGQAPLWNPDIYVGVPLLANAQWGALDPQVLLLVALDAIGGVKSFDMGFAWLALLRIAAAALGAYLFARRLGLTVPGAALAGSAFALSGSLILWLGFSIAHVTPLLPWVLLGIEGLRGGERPLRAFLMTSISMALAVYGGHPEVAFFVALGAGVWSLSLFGETRRGGYLALAALGSGVLLAAPVLLPFVEYLRHSGALVAHRLAPSERDFPDLISLAALILFAGFLWKWREMVQARAGDSGRPGKLLAVLPIVLAWLGFVLVSTGRGANFDPGLGPVATIEGGSAGVGLPVFALVLVALYSPVSGLRRARWVIALGGLAWLLAVGVPGVVDLWRWAPLIGLSAPQRAACCSALFLSILAGAVLERGSTSGRWAAVLSLVVLGVVAGARDRPDPLDVGLAGLDPADEIVTYRKLPPAILERGGAPLAGTLRGGLDIDELHLRFERLGERGEVIEEAGFDRIAELRPEAEVGTVEFDFGELAIGSLGVGDWRLKLEFIRAGEILALRFPALVHVSRPRSWDRFGLIIGALTAIALLLATNRAARGLLLALAVGNGVVLAQQWNPAVPRDQHFRQTRTAEFLTARFAGQRFFADPGIYPGDTALLTNAATIDGYDAMDVASFDGYRAYALKPGMNPLLDWNVRGADLNSPAFRLFGVRALLLHSRRTIDGWTLVAGPEGAPEPTEVFIYEADDPLPRAFCVSRILERRGVLEKPAEFDPRTSAFIEEGLTFELEQPFEHSEVQEISRGQRVLEYRVELDGEGLFICTEQHFPGWRVTVDDEPAELLRVNSIFRGVYLKSGTHQIRFEYQPGSWRMGKLVGVLGVLVTALGALTARRVLMRGPGS